MSRVFYKIEYITKVMRETKRNFWRLYDGNDKLLRETVTIENNYSLDDSIKVLEEAVNNASGQYCKLSLYPERPRANVQGESGTSKNTMYFLIDLEQQKETTSAPNNFGNNNFIFSLYEKINEANLNAIKTQHEFELKSLRAEMENLKKTKSENNGGFDASRILGLAENWLKAKQAPEVAPIIQTPPNVRPVAPGIFGHDDEKKKFSELVTRWKKADENFIQALEIIVKYAENNKQQYDFYMNALK